MMLENPNNELNYSLIDSFQNSEILGLSQDFLEIGLDSLLKEEIISEIPIVKTIVATYKVGVTISDKILIKKILLFLKELNDLPKETIEEFVEQINNNVKFKIKLGNKLILLLDKADDFEKPHMLAEVFKAYITKKIDYRLLQLLSQIINNTFIENIKILNNVYKKISLKEKIDHEILESLFQSGLVSVESQMVLDSNGLIYQTNNTGTHLIKILFNN